VPTISPFVVIRKTWTMSRSREYAWNGCQKNWLSATVRMMVNHNCFCLNLVVALLELLT